MSPFSLSNLKRRILALTTALAVGLTGAVVAQSTDPVTSDDLIWLYVQQLGSADAFAAYLAENPNGKFADLARTNLRELAAQGIVPAASIEGIEIAGLADGAALADLLGDPNAEDLSRFFFIEYAG